MTGKAYQNKKGDGMTRVNIRRSRGSEKSAHCKRIWAAGVVLEGEQLQERGTLTDVNTNAMMTKAISLSFTASNSITIWVDVVV